MFDYALRGDDRLRQRCHKRAGSATCHTRCPQAAKNCTAGCPIYHIKRAVDSATLREALTWLHSLLLGSSRMRGVPQHLHKAYWVRAEWLESWNTCGKRYGLIVRAMLSFLSILLVLQMSGVLKQ